MVCPMAVADLLGDDARGRVGRATGGIGHDQMDRMRRDIRRRAQNSRRGEAIASGHDARRAQGTSNGFAWSTCGSRVDRSASAHHKAEISCPVHRTRGCAFSPPCDAPAKFRAGNNDVAQTRRDRGPCSARCCNAMGRHPAASAASGQAFPDEFLRGQPSPAAAPRRSRSRCARSPNFPAAGR